MADKPAVAIIGTFDVRNYGDLLFPLMAAHRLGAHGHAVQPYSPTGTDTGWADTMRPTGIEALPGSARRHAALLIGGGNIIHFESARLRDYPRAIEDWAYPSLWAGATLMGAIARRPVIWNAPGAPKPFDPTGEAELVSRVIAAADYVSVRDEPSRAELDPGAAAGVAVVPDTIADLASLWPRASLARDFATLLARKAMPGGTRFFAVHPKLRALTGEDVARVGALVAAHAERTGLVPLLIAIGECHEDHVAVRQVANHVPGSRMVVDDAVGLREIAAAIAFSEHYIGCSLHGYITALAYERPGCIVAVPRLVKQHGFLAHVGRPDDLCGGWAAAFERAASATGPAGVPTTVLDAIDDHWAKVAGAIATPNPSLAKPRARLMATLLNQGTARGGWDWTIGAMLVGRQAGGINRQVASAPPAPASAALSPGSAQPSTTAAVRNLGDDILGLCTICGAKGVFLRGDNPSVRESYPCPSCRATLRYREQASAILDEFARGHETSIARLVASGRLDGAHIYEPALHGPFVGAFSGLPHYHRSYYWEGGKPGEELKGVPFGDLKVLPYPDRTFDLVITSDVFEHVIDPDEAFAEIRRVLKVGGVHIFSIPTRWPIDAVSVDRVRIVDDAIEHLLPPRYHRAGDGSPSLVITDFGSDIVDRLAAIGFHTQIQRHSLSIDTAYRNATFLSRRM
ncbi:polysaccharide pyruvyl transferase family protein [Sphingomonas sp. ID0503]|uniref:polysaccharide pyruvyl transferase family protein n=1 Tax=Sphingomonas sp. ID0503 TaxID=3399691 RepID=UPI003AFA4F63